MLSPLAPPSPATATRRRRAADRGFTLIELMIAIAVLGILAAVAFPSFMDSIRKNRRSEAFTALAQVQQAQERWRGNNAGYAASVSNAAAGDPPGLGLPATTPSGYYGIALSGVGTTGYTATATAVAGTSQAGDSSCTTMAVRMTGGNLEYAGCGGGDCAFAPTNGCWAK